MQASLVIEAEYNAPHGMVILVMDSGISAGMQSIRKSSPQERMTDSALVFRFAPSVHSPSKIAQHGLLEVTHLTAMSNGVIPLQTPADDHRQPLLVRSAD